MPSSVYSIAKSTATVASDQQEDIRVPVDEDVNAEFGGIEERMKIERRLLRKLDLRMSILIIIYILNYVRCICLCH